MTNLITKLREAAKKATPGDWCPSNIADPHDNIIEQRDVSAYVDGPVVCTIEDCHKGNQNYIALCSPENILALCEALDEARELLQGLTEFHPKSCAYFQGSECDCFLGAKHQQAGQKARAFLAKYFTEGET